jgi:peptidoglycan/xylan/chitin deacetylase (PgdA/CDA1 family)
MRLVSPLLKHVVYPGLSKAGYLRRAIRGPAVLTYHGVFPAGYKIVDPGLDGNLVSADSFRQQLTLIKEQYNVISPSEFRLWCEAGHELPRRSVLLTCDDGLRNTLFDMLPILDEFELECLFFVTGASLSQTATMLWYEELYLMFLAAPESFVLELPEIVVRAAASQREKRSLWWELVKRLSQYDLNARGKLLERIGMQLKLADSWDAEYREDPALSRRFLMLSLAELHQLAHAGTCIGAHTVSHPVLSQSTPDTAWSEISENKRDLETVLGQEMWALAYPFGDSSTVTQREVQMAERAGFQCAFLNVDGDFGIQTPKFALPRLHVTAEMTLAEFAARISGVHRSLQNLFRPASAKVAVGPNP